MKKMKKSRVNKYYRLKIIIWTSKILDANSKYIVFRKHFLIFLFINMCIFRIKNLECSFVRNYKRENLIKKLQEKKKWHNIIENKTNQEPKKQWLIIY